MPEFLQRLFSSSEFMPHGHCYFWRPEIVWLHVLSDAVIFAAYMTIPVTLFRFVRRRNDLPFSWVFLAFGTFIVSCGLTHALEIWTMWTPTYWLSGTVKAVTAVSSALTALLLVRLMPRALLLPSSEALRSALTNVERSEARLRAAAEGMTDAFYLFDAVRTDGAISDFRLMDVNAVGLSRVARTRENALERLYSDLYPRARGAGIIARFADVVTTGKPFEDDVLVPQPGTRGRTFHVRAVPLGDGLSVTSSEITERLQLERERMEQERVVDGLRELARRDAQLRSIGEAIPQIVWTATPDGGLDYYNQRWFDYTGLTLAETEGWGWAPVIHPDDLAQCVAVWSEAVRTGDPYEVEYRFKRGSDGAYRWHLGRALPMRDAEGAIVKWFGTSTDIDDQRRAQDALRDAQRDLEQRVSQRTAELALTKEAVAASEARFRAAANGMKDSFYLFDAERGGDGRIRDFRFIDANDAGGRSFKLAREDLVGRLRSELVHSAGTSADARFASFTRAVETAEPYEELGRVVDADGNHLWVEIRAVAVNDGLAVTVRDVTERRRMDEERDLHAAVLKSISEGVCLVRASDATIVYANPKFATMLGYAYGELEGQPLAVIRTPQRADEPPASTERVGLPTGRGDVTTYQGTNVRKDGEVIHCQSRTTTLQSPTQGEIWVLVKEDVTERRQTEAERDGFFTLSIDMLAVASFNGYFTQLNPAWETALGWTLDELKAKPFVELVHPEDRPSTNAERSGLAEGNTTLNFENRYLAKDGRYRVLQWRAVSSITHGVIFAVARDVTMLREAADAVKSSLLEKETLLKEVHHRVKNNLQVISSLLKLHAEQITEPSARAAFSDSQDRVRAIALLHEKLYASKDLGSVSAQDYVEGLVQTLIRTHGAERPARTTIDASDVTLPFDLAVPCGLILNELITNSLKHAFPASSARPPEIHVSFAREGDDLLLEVTDNGIGLPPALELERANTLGMHLVRTLARQLQAKASMTSLEGARWSFRFPITP